MPLFNLLSMILYEAYESLLGNGELKCGGKGWIFGTASCIAVVLNVPWSREAVLIATVLLF